MSSELSLGVSLVCYTHTYDCTLTLECIELFSNPRVEAEILHQFYVLVSIVKSQVLHLCVVEGGKRKEGWEGERVRWGGRSGQDKREVHTSEVKQLDCNTCMGGYGNVMKGGKCQLH